MRHAAAIRRERGLPPLRTLGSDLRRVARWQVTVSLAVPWCCLGIYIASAVQGWWPLAVLGVMALSFFTYGSISHDLVHGNLGLPRWLNDALLCATELLAVRSGHAYRAVHLHHHARYPADDDVEGAASRMSLGRTIVEGMILQPRCWRWAVRRGGSSRGWIWFEGAACAAIIIASVVLVPFTIIPAVYVALVIAGSWIIPLITSYIPHAPDAADPLKQTRLFRGRLLSWIAVEHLYHLEHHLYPQVPHHHWAELARRLDPHFERAGLQPIHPGAKR